MFKPNCLQTTEGGTGQFVARGLIRTKESKKNTGGAYDVFVGGIRDAGSNVHVIEGIDALVILTSVCLR